MEWLNVEIVHPAIGYMVTAALAGVLGWFGKRLSDIREHKNKIQNTLDEIKKELEANSLISYKAIIYSDNPAISMNEKLKSYQSYKKLGGNGFAYKYMCELLGTDVDEYLANHGVQ